MALATDATAVLAGKTPWGAARRGRSGPSVDIPLAPQDDGTATQDAPDELAVLVRRAQQGDEQAFRLVYRQIQPMLLRYLLALVGADAEDVASEAWLQITRDLHSFRGDGENFRGWAATVARHRAMDHLRRLRRRIQPVASEEAMAELVAQQDTAAEAIQSMSTGAAMAMIASLPRDQAEAVLLRVVMGLNAEIAGQVLGKRAGAVRTSAHRGLRRLADRLRADEAMDLPCPQAGRSIPGGVSNGGVTETGPGTLGNTR